MRAHTPKSLAEYWSCSERHVRNLIEHGELRAFRLGQKLLRIPLEAVDEYEKEQTAKLAQEAATTRRHEADKSAIRIARMVGRLRRP